MRDLLVRTVAAAAVALPASLAGAVTFDDNVTNNVIFGSGNTNGGFTVDRNDGEGVELGLRGKLRFDDNNRPQAIYNSDGAGGYSMPGGAPSPGFGFAPNDPQAARWNFDWSINSNFNGNGGNVGGLFYQMSLDLDPGVGIVDFFTFDPMRDITSMLDHSFGNNSTTEGGGAEAADAATYLGLLASSNLAQNSWNYLFFVDRALPGFAGFDPRLGGEYTIELTAFRDAAFSDELARSSINVNVSAVPVPASLLMLLSALGGLAGLGAARRRAAAA